LLPSALLPWPPRPRQAITPSRRQPSRIIAKRLAEWQHNMQINLDYLRDTFATVSE
jgi:hypothetical protein